MSDLERSELAGSTAKPEVAQTLQHLSARSVRLTPRESDVARGIVNGLTNKRLARELGISEFTVRDHVSALLRKCQAATRTRLAVLVSSGTLMRDELIL